MRSPTCALRNGEAVVCVGSAETPLDGDVLPVVAPCKDDVLSGLWVVLSK